MTQAPNGEYIPARPHSSMSLFSDQEELGEENMMSFFRTHMTTILKPFAQNVEELHKFAMGISDHVREVNARTEANASAIAEQAALIDGVQRENASHKSHSNDTKVLLEDTIKDLKNLVIEVKPLRLKIDVADRQITKTQCEVSDLQKGIEEARSRINRCQTVEERNRGEITSLQDKLERLTADVVALDIAHESTINTINAQKASFEKHVHDNLAIHRDQKEIRSKFDIINEHAEDRFRRFDERNSEVQRQLLHFRQEAHQANEATLQLLSGRLDQHHASHEETRDRLNKHDTTMSDHHAITVENGENFQKLLKFMEQRHEENVRELRDLIGKTDDRIKEQVDSIKEINRHINGYPPDKDGRNRFEVLEEDLDYTGRRADRLDKALGLTPLTKGASDMMGPGITFKAGVMLTDAQVREFEHTFHRFDSNSSGTVSQQEVCDLVKSLGHDCPAHIVQMLMKDLDSDRSGEINFDEFCALMAKMLGPDGKVDIEALIGQLSEEAAREAQQQEIFDMVPQHSKMIHNQQIILDQDHVKIASNGKQLQSLEGQYAELANEVVKLRKGLQLSQEYWRGLSRGLKETKKTVQNEGDEQMLPNANRLRSALPALSARPSTHPCSPVGNVGLNMTSRSS